MEFFSAQFKDLTESNDKGADTLYRLGFLYHHGCGVRKIHSRGIECYTFAAEKGHIHAQYNLACLYQENTDINYRHAFKWFKLSAEAGHGSAQNCLAYFFEKGIVVEVDFSEALYWYSKAAANNNKGAMVNIARMYRKGMVDDQPNYPQSIEWYKKVSQVGSSAAKNCLYQLSQRKGLADGNYRAGDDLIHVQLSVKDMLCSRLRQDMATMPDSPDPPPT
jgi:TPR repeat protein